MTDVDIGEYEHMLDVCLLACLNIENQPAAFYYYYLIVIIAIKGFLSLQVFFLFICRHDYFSLNQLYTLFHLEVAQYNPSLCWDYNSGLKGTFLKDTSVVSVKRIGVWISTQNL